MLKKKIKEIDKQLDELKAKKYQLGLIDQLDIKRESHFNPGVWENQDVTTGYISGYGLVQWTPSGDKFLNWANLNAISANNMATNNPKQLIDLQLEYLIYSSLSTTSTSLVDRQWYKTTGYGSPQKMTYEEYIVSTLDAGDLALVFHGSYERSNDTATVKQERKDYANRWYDYFTQGIVSNDLFK